ncbi:MAG: ribonuclease HII [Prolixibacteraceae bacterium]|nr:ribonuclease HII [Prolixibacteraceae bacterium]
MTAGLQAYYKAGVVEAGCDEAGRGCLAGPVYAAAVILPPGFSNPLLNDSKQLSEKQRYGLRPVIEKEALAWAIGIVSNHEVDEINVLNASYLAMHRAIEKLTVKPGFLIIDGNRFKPYAGIPHTCIVKGDGKYFSIAAASVLAKTCRDEYMMKIDREYPQYGWGKNKGYPTLKHRKALMLYGQTPYHRKSFRLFENQLKIEFPGTDNEMTLIGNNEQIVAGKYQTVLPGNEEFKQLINDKKN